jgi:putative hydrolase of the HAD superfamily
MPIQAVLFDLDNTLIVDEPDTGAALLATCALAQRHVGLAPETLYHSVRLHAHQVWQNAAAFPYCQAIGISAFEGLCAHFLGTDPRLETLRAWGPTYRQTVWSQALAAHGVYDDTLIAQLAAHFETERYRSYNVFPDTVATLQSLRTTYALGMITNGAPDLQSEKIRRTALANYFDVILISGAVGVGKPDPRIFTMALEQLAVPATAAVMVGDNMFRDIKGAQQVGVKGVWIPRVDGLREASVIPDAHITGLSELHAVLQAWS